MDKLELTVIEVPDRILDPSVLKEFSDKNISNAVDRLIEEIRKLPIAVNKLVHCTKMANNLFQYVISLDSSVTEHYLEWADIQGVITVNQGKIALMSTLIVKTYKDEKPSMMDIGILLSEKKGEYEFVLSEDCDLTEDSGDEDNN